MSDFSPRFCDRCKEPKNRLIDGVDIILRCSCDWEAGFGERLRATCHPAFWSGWSLTQWDPPIFKYGGIGVFKNFIKLQKANAINKMYDFCFRILENDPEPGKRRFAIYKSMEKGKTLFIRGPQNSGRGCLISCIKMFCATKQDISATPNPADWSTFKSEILQSEWNGKEADMMKLMVAEQYQNVKMLCLENVKGEGELIPGDKFPRRPFRGSNMVDALLTKRAFQPGGMVLTSGEFIKEIGDTVGDKLPDILQSDSTSLILLFSPKEADALYEGLLGRMNALRLEASSVEGRDQAKTLQNKISIERLADTIKECLYLEKAFPTVSPIGTESLTERLTVGGDMFPPEALATYAEFNKEWATKGLAYEEGLKRAYQSAASGSKELSYKMSPRELVETGKMMSDACGEDEDINKLIRAAREKRDKILSEKTNHD